MLSEIGSLSVEFTRLAQITKEQKYYDAVARITNELEAWQNHTILPGMWPMAIDASGCHKVVASSVPNHVDSNAQQEILERSAAGELCLRNLDDDIQ